MKQDIVYQSRRRRHKHEEQVQEFQDLEDQESFIKSDPNKNSKWPLNPRFCNFTKLFQNLVEEYQIKTAS